MQTAYSVTQDMIRANVTLHDMAEDHAFVVHGDLILATGLHENVLIVADAEIAQLLNAVTTIGETFDARVVDDGDRFVIVHLDGYMDMDDGFDHEQEPTGDPTIDAIMEMEAVPIGCAIGDGVVLSGHAGIRLIERTVRGDDGEVDFDAAEDHVLLELPFGDAGLSATIAAAALWDARRAEYAATVAFYEQCRADAEGGSPMRYDDITAENIRARTRLAAMGLTPNTTGRSYHIADMHWVGCSVRPCADGWLDVSMKIDT